MKRVVTPELLDSLPPNDPSAIRSRLDLQRINGMMGNARWVRQSIKCEGLVGAGRVVEVGAGDGLLASSLAKDGFQVTAVDFCPEPPDLPQGVTWLRGDILHELPALTGDVLIANLIWHHFSGDQLASLKPIIKSFPLVLASEPLRAHYPQVLGAALVPIVNSVTRHDLFASIRAGFRPGELPVKWNLKPPAWAISEESTLLGAYRLTARRCER